MIHIQNIAFAYLDSREILKDISFDLKGGHCLALLGNNGAGKSTLLKCLNGIFKSKAGLVEVNNIDISKMKRNDIAKTMAYVDQENEVSQFTVYDYILMGRKPYIKVSPLDTDIAIINQAIERMKLKGFELRYIDELSGGELQKVALARALAQQPEVLLLDEPTSSLDLYNQHGVMQIISEISRNDGIIVIVVIHDLNLAIRYCDRFLFIKDGNVYSYGDESVITAETVSEVYHVDAKIIDIFDRKLVIV